VSKAAVASSGVASSSFARGGGGRGRGGKRQLPDLLVTSTSRSLFGLFLGGRTERFPMGRVKKKRADPLFSGYPLFFGGCLL
jgi:hypothetical protein